MPTEKYCKIKDKSCQLNMKKFFDFGKFCKKLESQNIDIAEFIKLSKIPRQTVYAWKRIKTIRDFKYRTAIENVLNCKYSDLCEIQYDESLIKTNTCQTVENTPKTIPVICNSNSSKWIEYLKNPDGQNVTNYVELENNDGNNKFSIRIENDSMCPMFNIGDVVIFENNTEYSDGGYYIISWKQGSNTRSEFRRLFMNESDYILRPLNPIYPEITVKEQDVIKIVKAIKVIRSL